MNRVYTGMTPEVPVYIVGCMLTFVGLERARPHLRIKYKIITNKITRCTSRAPRLQHPVRGGCQIGGSVTSCRVDFVHKLAIVSLINVP